MVDRGVVFKRLVACGYIPTEPTERLADEVAMRHIECSTTAMVSPARVFACSDESTTACVVCRELEKRDRDQHRIDTLQRIRSGDPDISDADLTKEFAEALGVSHGTAWRDLTIRLPHAGHTTGFAPQLTDKDIERAAIYNALTGEDAQKWAKFTAETGMSAGGAWWILKKLRVLGLIESTEVAV